MWLSCVAPSIKHTPAGACHQVLPSLYTNWGTLPAFLATPEGGAGLHQPGAASACSTGLVLGSCKGGWEGWRGESVTMAREQVPCCPSVHTVQAQVHSPFTLPHDGPSARRISGVGFKLLQGSQTESSADLCHLLPQGSGWGTRLNLRVLLTSWVREQLCRKTCPVCVSVYHPAATQEKVERALRSAGPSQSMPGWPALPQLSERPRGQNGLHSHWQIVSWATLSLEVI